MKKKIFKSSCVRPLLWRRQPQREPQPAGQRDQPQRGHGPGHSLPLPHTQVQYIQYRIGTVQYSKVMNSTDQS